MDFTLREIAELLGEEGGVPKKIQNVCIDSREVERGDLFFALKGEKTDGHLFLRQVAKKQAVGAVVARDYDGPTYGLQLIYVDEMLDALQKLAAEKIRRVKPRIAAVTGSLGKTTTKDFVLQFLQRDYAVIATEGNRNSQIGLPVTLFNQTREETEVLVVEMGMTHSGNISKLIEIAPPETALVTTVELVHAVNFGSIEDIAKAKAEIFNHPRTKLAIYPYEIEKKYALPITHNLEKRTFSMTQSKANFYWESGTDIIYKNGEKFGSVPHFPFQGEQHRHNLLAAIVLADAYGVEWKSMKEIIPHLKMPKLRAEQILKNGITFVNDSYNAAAASTIAALRSLPAPKEGKKRIAVIGGMLELGKFSEGAHLKVGEEALHHIDLMLCFGPECRPIVDVWRKFGRPVVLCDCRSELALTVKKEAEAGDVVLIKGSRAHKLWKILED